MTSELSLTTGDVIPTLAEANYILILTDIMTKNPSMYEELVSVVLNNSLSLAEESIKTLKSYNIFEEDEKTPNKAIQEIVRSIAQISL
jgi:hypothetical protein